VPVAGGAGQAAVTDARRAAGSGAPAGNRNAWRHGGRSAEALTLRRLASAWAARPAAWRDWSGDSGAAEVLSHQ
jgi:hypothetical protein